MHLISLEIENFRRIKLARIRPDGALVRVCGNNAAGKSSVLDAIEVLLRGKRAAGSDPVRHGAQQAQLIGDFGDYQIHRKIRPDGRQVVEVVGLDGGPLRSPETVLKRLLGDHTLDPLAFMRCDAKEQAATLRKLAGIDTSELDVERERVFMERTAVNRAKKQLNGELAGLPRPAPGEPVHRVEVHKLVEMATAQQRENAARASEVARLDAMRREASDRNSRIGELQAKIADMQGELDALNEAREKAKIEGQALAAKVEQMPHHDLDAIQAEIAEATANNSKAEKYARRVAVEEQMEDRRRESDAMTERLAEIDREKAEILEGAKMPVDGLEVTDDGVQYQGVPLEQASQAEKIRVSVAIAFAQSPEVKVLMVYEASLLDESSMQLLAELAEAQGGQVWAEIVGKGDVGILLEDGEVTAVDGQPVE